MTIRETAQQIIFREGPLTATVTRLPAGFSLDCVCVGIAPGPIALLDTEAQARECAASFVSAARNGGAR